MAGSGQTHVNLQALILHYTVESVHCAHIRRLLLINESNAQNDKSVLFVNDLLR